MWLERNFRVSDKERLELIEKDWVAPPGFQWPSTTRMDHGKERRKFLSKTHFIGQYKCFAYSQLGTRKSRKTTPYKICASYWQNWKIGHTPEQ
jgi:hypothetical protein